MNLQGFTVTESTWERGNGDSSLLRFNGKMCCLGHIGKQCGFEDYELRGKGYPMNTRYEERWPSWFFFKDSAGRLIEHDDVWTMASINDDDKITDDERKLKLNEIAAKHGMVLKFIP